MNNNKKNEHKILKVAGIVLIAFLVMAIGDLIGEKLTLPLTHSSNAGISFAGLYASFIGIWIAFIGLFLLCKRYRPLLSKIGPKEAGNNMKTALLIGLPFGMGLNLVVAFTAMLHKDIAISFSGFNPLMLLCFIVVVIIQSGAEELVTRCFLYESIKKYFPNIPAIAIVLNAALFAAFHLGNEGVTALSLLNILLVGILYSLFVYYFNSFWAAVVAHASWNFCQNIILGLPNSGIVTKYSIFKLDAASATNSFTYHTAFGIEGTVMSCILLTLACIVVICIGRKKNQKTAAKMHSDRQIYVSKIAHQF